MEETDELISYFYSSITHNPNLLLEFDRQHFANTPLHAAMSKGQTLLALEIRRLMPSLGRKLNLDGYTPVDLALQFGHLGTVCAMIKVDPLLVDVAGREGMTPLHWAAECGEIDMLAEFLLACPDSVERLTIRQESAIHLAVKNGQFGAFHVLLGWVRRTDRKSVLHSRDWEGNTALHHAAYTNQPKVIELLVKEISINDKNFKGLSALDVVMKLPSNMNERALQILQKRRPFFSHHNIPTLANYLSSPVSFSEKMIKLFAYLDMGMTSDMRNSILVVAVLIATATFQVGLNPPNGFNDDDNGRSKKTQLQRNLIVMFSSLNSIALAASLVIIVMILPTHWNNVLLYVSLLFLTVSYTVATMVMYPGTWALAMPHATCYMVIAICLIKIGIPRRENGWVSSLLSGKKYVYSWHDVRIRVFHGKYSDTQSELSNFKV